MLKKIRVKNKFGEELDAWVEGNEDSKIIVVFVAGLGSDKHETLWMFDELAQELATPFQTVRFDFAGFGKSQGDSQETDYYKESQDLEVVLAWVRENLKKKIYILAMSMGCFVTCLLSPDEIEKTILLSIPNHNMEFILNQVKEMISSRPGGIFDENGVTVFPRRSGQVQKYGPKFWKTMREFKPLENVTKMAQRTNLLIVHALQDEIVGDQFVEEYRLISGVTYLEINGDHCFTKSEDRKIMMEKVRGFFEKNL